MPQFKVKDLMINILPTDIQRFACTLGGCGGCGQISGACLDTISECPNGYTPLCACDQLTLTGGGPWCPIPGQTLCPYNSQLQCGRFVTNNAAFAGPQALATLKVQLRQALANVEAQERVMEEMLRPQTLEDIDLLEQKMTAALEELRARKAELQTKPPEGQQ